MHLADSILMGLVTAVGLLGAGLSHPGGNERSHSAGRAQKSSSASCGAPVPQRVFGLVRPVGRCCDTHGAGRP